jgi:lipopolysaccharide heptosyltransferase II
MSAARWAAAKSVLCVRPDNLGDVLMTTPALRALKESLPGRKIVLLASPAGAQAARFVAEIDDVIEYRAPWVKQAGASLDGLLPLAQRLGSRGFDAAVIFTVYSQSPLPAALLCAAAGIPLRLAHCRENPYQLLTDWVRETEPEAGVRHEVRRQLDLVRHVGCSTRDERLSFSVPAAATAWAQRRLREFGIDPGAAWALIHPGASAPSRRYPPELWADAARHLAGRHGCPIVLAAGGDEIDLVRTIRQAALPVRVHSLCGELDLARLAAVIALAPVLLCNNSGPAHIAAAVGTPLVDLYALTNPQHTPWAVSHRVLFHDVPCRFCYRSECPQGHHACLRRVDPLAVAEAGAALLAAAEPGARAATATISELMDFFSLRMAAG